MPPLGFCVERTTIRVNDIDACTECGIIQTIPNSLSAHQKTSPNPFRASSPMKTRLGVLNMKVMMHPLLVHSHLRLLLVLITQASIPILSASSDDLSEATFFERRIRPLLLDHCQDCHGTLNEGMPHLPLLDSREAFVGDSALVVPGSPACLLYTSPSPRDS